MIEYLFNAIGLDQSLVTSDFKAFAGMLIVCVSVFGITKLIFIIVSDMFGGL